MLRRTIGSYQITGMIGEGGMGVVYVGEHVLLGRKAAIKVLLPQLSQNEELVQRFFNEARAVTQVADAGIVQVFDFGHHTDGSAYIVMELLDGEAMDRRLARKGRFPPLEVLRLARLLCSSLAAAHAKGIVHRDLKPENIFLVSDPGVTGGERAKILDFGIAKLSSEDRGHLKTRTGMMMGTPVYMSPEQCRGAGEVDARSDIYSLGCVIMTMLTGRPPFDGDATGELIAAHLREPAPLAASRIAGLPVVFDEILQRCLAKSPSDRFSTMAALGQALGRAEQLVVQSLAPSSSDAAMTYVPTPTTLSSAAGVASPAPRRARSLVAIAAIAAVSGLGLFGVYRTQSGTESQPDEVPARPSTSVVVSPSLPVDGSPDAAPVDAPPDAAPVDAPPVLVDGASAPPVDAKKPSRRTRVPSQDAGLVPDDIDRGS